MAADDSLSAGQADPGPGELVRSMQALERLEQLAGVLHVEPDAVVTHDELGATVVFACGELDPGMLAGRRELPRVPEQVLQDGPDQRPIPCGRQPIGDRELDPALGLGGLQLGRDFSCQVAEVDPVAVQLRAETRESPSS